MKKIIIYFMLAIIISGCSNYAQTGNDQRPLHQVAIMCVNESDSSYHKICFDSVVYFISSFLHQTDELYQRANQYTLGGFISRETIEKLKPKDFFELPAFKFYACYDKVPIFKNKVFM